MKATDRSEAVFLFCSLATLFLKVIHKYKGKKKLHCRPVQLKEFLPGDLEKRMTQLKSVVCASVKIPSGCQIF